MFDMGGLHYSFLCIQDNVYNMHDSILKLFLRYNRGVNIKNELQSASFNFSAKYDLEFELNSRV